MNMPLIFKEKPNRNLKEPYVKVRHVAIFETEEEAVTAAKRLNYNVYLPLGLTKEEMRVLYDEERSKYGVEEHDNKFHLIERSVF